MAQHWPKVNSIPYATRDSGGAPLPIVESQGPQRSAPLEHLRQNKLVASSNEESYEPKRFTRLHSISPCRKRRRTQSERATSDDKSPKRQPIHTEDDTSALDLRISVKDDEEHPIAYWAANSQWPQKYFETGMQNVLARKRPVPTRSARNSDGGSAASSLSSQSEQYSREEKSAGYRRLQYATVLATKGVLMESSEIGVSQESKKECRSLLEKEAEIPEHSLFRDDVFEVTCRKIQDKNEARVIQDISRLLVPSAETLHTFGATHLRCLVESVNQGWNNSIPITKTRPQPDYAVGFRREAFTQDQLNRMQPIVGDIVTDLSYIMATWYMYFPFLTCEVKCGAAALDVADRQNAHSTAIAVRAVVALFQAVKREKELHRKILAFSVSHDHCSVRIYGYYAEFDGAQPKYYRHTIHKFDFTTLDGKEKWTAYNFTKNVYDSWMPMHFENICSAIDELPISKTSGLSQDLSAYSITQSSAGSASALAQDDLPTTPSTPVTEGGASKRPRRGEAPH